MPDSAVQSGLNYFAEKTKNLNKSEANLKKVTKDRDELESAIDQLRDELSKTEVTKKQLKHQVCLQCCYGMYICYQNQNSVLVLVS